MVYACTPKHEANKLYTPGYLFQLRIKYMFASTRSKLPTLASVLVQDL